MPPRPCAWIAVALLGFASLGRSEALPTAPVELFPLSAVRLLPGPLQHARELNEAYVLAHDVDRLLAPYRLQAGLEAKAPKYPNWESSGLDGHTLGHYLTALAQGVATDAPEPFRERMEYLLAELAACQQAGGTGYVGPIPGSAELWREVAAGQLKVEPFSVNGRWVPWYNLHKLFAGLRDAWVLTDHATARNVLVRLTDWCDALVAGLDEKQMQEMLRAEHGGMNEVLADVAALTGERRYLELARRFSHQALLQPLLRGEDPLTGLHANTQIPKAIGFARIAELDPAAQSAGWAEAAEFFWQTVIDERSVAFGGNSVREHFNAPDDFTSVLESREGPETCNTYNMLRLSEQLFRMSPEARYADYYERALYNHILASQHPEHGGFVYFTPIRPQHYRVYSQPEQCFWCCVGSGIENHGKYGRFVYAHRGNDKLFVNLFIPSELSWKERQLEVRQETRFPDEASTRLIVRTSGPQVLEILLRHPAWVAGDLPVRINGEPWPVESAPGSYASIRRTWHEGDRIEVQLPMTPQLERLPDGSDYAALLYGPIVLAAPTEAQDLEGLIAGDGRMAHIAPGPYRPLETAPMLVGDLTDLSQHLRPVEGEPLTFRAPTLIRPESARDLVLKPFFRVHDTRYMMYWRTASADEYENVVRELREAERARLLLAERTLDLVTPGEQQPEVEHNYAGEGSDTGVSLGRRWRDASGYFEYRLRPQAPGPWELLVTYAAWERGRAFDLEVNGRVIASVALDGHQPDRFVETTYPIPTDVTPAADGSLQVRFVAKPGSRTGSIYELRLLRRN